MSTFRTMKWDDEAWGVVKRTSSTIPPFARVKSLRAIIEASEWAAKQRRGQRVEVRDIVKGVKERAPEAYRDLFLNALREQSIDVDKY